MPTSRICVVVDVPAERLWARLSCYGSWGEWNEFSAGSAIEGYPGVANVPVGAVRAVLSLENPRTRERLVTVDELTRTVQYAVEEQPVWQFPARRYVGAARILALTDRQGSVIDWSGRYDCDLDKEPFMDELLTGFYASFVAWLVKACSEATP